MQRSSLAYIFGLSIHLTDIGLTKVHLLFLPSLLGGVCGDSISPLSAAISLFLALH